jgi:ferredoxin--NADP+ reductase
MTQPSVTAQAGVQRRADIDHLRASYNARVTEITRCHDDLLLLRVRPDRGLSPFVAGQYTVLGLGYWEPRVRGVQDEGMTDADYGKLIKRAYSISCPMLDEHGQLVRAAALAFFEFYIALVRFAEANHPPALTPRLFALQPGDGIFCGPHIHGSYTLRQVRRDQNVVFVATGTGEAPHNAMLSELLVGGHRGRIVSVTCVRYRKDLAYLAAHRRLEERFPNYRYLPLTTREAENTNPAAPGYVGKRYLQDYVAAGDLERDGSLQLAPESTHVFLCGSPAMIGVPRHTHDSRLRYPQPLGMIELLERRGFRIDQPHDPGNIHFEKYW